MDGELIEIGAFWKKTAKSGKVYYSGQIDDEWVMLFPVESDNPRAPKFRLCKQSMSGEEAQQESSQQPGDNRFIPDDDAEVPDSAGPNDDDIPF